MTPLKNAWHHIRRSPFQSLVAIIVMTISFFSLGLFVIISQGMSSVLNYFETKPEITIFLKDGLDSSAVEGLQKELSDYPKIREIKFISKVQALQIYKEQNKNNPMLTEMVTASILPASFEVSVSDPKVLEQIALDFSAKTSQIDEIIYQKDIIKSLLNWTDFIRKAGIVVVSATTTTTFLIIFVIIGMKITNRKDEISVSRLLGASNFYVKRPFLIEGVIYGLIGSFIGLLVTYSFLAYFYRQINLFFNPIVFISTDLRFYTALLLSSLALGSLIGYSASWIGVKRYIRF
jgi:cell division transport system permease protein